MDNRTVLYVLMTAGIVSLVYLLDTYAGSSYKRKVLRRSFRCLLGDHSPGPVEEVVGGRRIQHCDYCGKKVREYAVTKDQILGTDKIRRL